MSRATVRHALGGLARRGLIDRGIGRGTFVRAQLLELGVSRLAGLTEELERVGLEPGAQVLVCEQQGAAGDVAAALALAAGSRVVHVLRLRLGGGIPLTLEEFWLPGDAFPGLGAADLGGSLYALMRYRYGRRPVRASERLQSIRAVASDARALGVPAGSPLTLVMRVAYDAQGMPVEFAKDRHRGDRVRFAVEVPESP